MAEKENSVMGKSPEQFPIAKNLEILTPEEFRRDFGNETALTIAACPDHDKNLTLPDSQRPSMGIEAMWIEFHGQNMKPIFASILKAAKAGFDVELHRDWYSDTILNQEFIWLPPTRFVSKKRRSSRMWVSGFTHKRLGILEDEGAKIVPINVPKSLLEKVTYLFRGRDHKKIIFIKDPSRDRMITWVGGMNLAGEHFRQLDFMVKIDDPAVVQPLIDEFHQADDKNKRKTNAEIRATNDTTILIDTGKENSIILQQAIKDINSAQKTIYVSSAFLPSGEFLKALVRAKKRGVHIAYITSNPDVTKGLLGIQGKISDLRSRRKRKIPVMFPENALVHAKALVIDEESVIFGSHNFVKMPHEELSLRSTNPKFVENIVNGFFRKVAGPNLDRKLKGDFIIPS